MKEYSTPTIKTEYNRNNMVGFFREYQTKLGERNKYAYETGNLTNIDHISEEVGFEGVKDEIVKWLSDMSKAGLIDSKDSEKVDNLLTSAYEKLNSQVIYEKIEELDHRLKQKLNNLQRSFDEAPENTGYLTKILQIQILGLKIDKVDTINKILEKEGVYVSKNYFENSNKERGNFYVSVYADNQDKLVDIQDKITVESLKNNFKGNVKISNILSSEEAFKFMTDVRNDVLIGSHIDKIVKPIHMHPEKPKNVGKLRL